MFGIFKRKKEKEEDSREQGLPLEFEDIKRAIDSKKENPFIEDNPSLPNLPPLREPSTAPQPIGFPPTPQGVPKEQNTVKTEMAIERKPIMEKPEVYVKIDRYKEILETLDSIMIKIKEVEGIVQELKSLKDREGNRMQDWERELEELKNKVNFVISSLEGE